MSLQTENATIQRLFAECEIVGDWFAAEAMTSPCLHLERSDSPRTTLRGKTEVTKVRRERRVEREI
jgi:hypothetical protein